MTNEPLNFPACRCKVRRKKAQLVELPTYQRHCSSEAVGILEDILAKARDGTVTGVAIATTNLDGGVSTAHSPSSNFVGLAAGVAILSHRVVESMRKGAA